MIMLPIVDRELRVAARLTATYRNRLLTGGVVGLVAILMMTFGLLTGRASGAGGAMFRTLSFLALLFCVLEGARKTADCLSEERREGTLGLLFLTDLKSYDVVLGKLVAASLSSVYGLVAILPIIAMSLLLGGVTPGEFWRMTLALTSVLFFSLVTGLFVSAHARSERNAMSASVTLVVAMLLVPPLTGVSWLEPWSPGLAFSHAFEGTYLRDAGAYWRSLEYAQLSSWILLAWTSVRSARFHQEETLDRSLVNNRPKSLKFWQPTTTRRQQIRAKWISLQPITFLCLRNQGRPFLPWLVFAVVAFFCALTLLREILGLGHDAFTMLMMVFYLANFVIKMRFGAQACNFMAEARSSQALELILSTPLTITEIIRGQTRALKQMFLIPVACLLTLEVCTTLLLAFFWPSGSKVIAGITSLWIAAFYIFIFGLDIVALFWAGMWFGLSSKRESQAVFKTIGFVLVLPMLALIAWFFAYPAFVGWNVVISSWASENIRRELRKLVGQQYDRTRDKVNWWTLK